MLLVTDSRMLELKMWKQASFRFTH